METLPNDRPVILFDAGCNLCLAAVDFVRLQGGEGRFRFVPLGSVEAATLLTDGGESCDTVYDLVARHRLRFFGRAGDGFCKRD